MKASFDATHLFQEGCWVGVPFSLSVMVAFQFCFDVIQLSSQTRVVPKRPYRPICLCVPFETSKHPLVLKINVFSRKPFTVCTADELLIQGLANRVFCLGIVQDFI